MSGIGQFDGSMSRIIIDARDDDQDNWRVYKMFIILPESPEIEERCVNDLSFFYNLNHPNLISTLTSVKSVKNLRLQGSCNNYVVVATPFKNLFALSDVYHSLPPNEFIPEVVLAYIAKNVLTAIWFMQKEAKTMHRNVQPSNILLSTKGEVILNDYAVMGIIPEGTLGKLRSIVGAETYHAPERLQGETFNANCDVWSLGVSLIEAKKKQYPYGTSSAVEVIDNIYCRAHEAIPNPDQSTSEAFCDFIRNCLERDPSKRPQASALLQHPFLQQCEGEGYQAVLRWLDAQEGVAHPRPLNPVHVEEFEVLRSAMGL